jgi:hypothetical protein
MVLLKILGNPAPVLGRQRGKWWINLIVKVSVSMGELTSEHPFTILDIKEDYYVRYGWSSRREGYSPKAKVLHQTAEEMEVMGISAESLEAAALAWRTGYHPNPIAPTPTQVTPKRKMRKVGKQQGRKGEYHRDQADDRI